uniref:Histamine H3 receptor n=1 Tax=Muribaculaceae bacterium Z82 TaxID=2304548 RepID=A0A7C9JDC0_9BACT
MDETGNGKASSERRQRRRWPVVVAAVAVVLAAAGAGFWVWHEQPSFCNAVCHEPMDAYVEGYYGDAGQMAYAHQAAGTSCLQCHEAKVDEQIHEAAVWLAGDFDTDEEGHLTRVGVRSDAAMCATAGCHDMEQVAAATADWGGQAGANPHDSHQGYALDCSSCHTAHGQSVMYCNTCHDFAVPQGWVEPRSSEPATR